MAKTLFNYAVNSLFSTVRLLLRVPDRELIAMKSIHNNNLIKFLEKLVSLAFPENK